MLNDATQQQKSLDVRDPRPYHESMVPRTRFYFVSFYYYGLPATGRGWRRMRD